MAFITRLIASVRMTPKANEIAPSGSGVDSSRDCSHVDRVLIDFDGGRVVPALIQFGIKF